MVTSSRNASATLPPPLSSWGPRPDQVTRGTFCGGLDFRPCLLSQRRDFLRRLRVEDAGRDFRRGEEAGPGLPAPEAWGVRLPGLGAASGPGRLGVLHVRIGPGAPWLGTHGRQRTARLALRGGGVTGECRPAIFRPGPAALVCAAAASRRAGLVCVLRGGPVPLTPRPPTPDLRAAGPPRPQSGPRPPTPPSPIPRLLTPRPRLLPRHPPGRRCGWCARPGRPARRVLPGALGPRAPLPGSRASVLPAPGAGLRRSAGSPRPWAGTACGSTSSLASSLSARFEVSASALLLRALGSRAHLLCPDLELTSPRGTDKLSEFSSPGFPKKQTLHLLTLSPILSHSFHC